MKKGPNPIPLPLKKHLLQNLPKGLVDGLAEFIHDSWWEEKIKQGFHHPLEKHPNWDEKSQKRVCDKCHLDMIPNSELPESSKRFDYVTIETTLAGLRLLGYHVHPNPNKSKFNMKKWINEQN